MIVCARAKFKIFIAALVCVVAAIVLLCCILPLKGRTLNFNVTFYYVCYDAPQDAHSASSMASVVQSYGGAGYTVECGGNYLVAVACYYSPNDAESVCSSLNKKGMPCSVIKAEAKDIKIKGGAKRNKQKYEGNLNTMYSLSKICYNLANSLDRLEEGQGSAKAVLSDVRDGLNSLCRQNATNCFSGDLRALYSECASLSDGYLLSRDVRRLQIAIIDSIVNIKLY